MEERFPKRIDYIDNFNNFSMQPLQTRSSRYVAGGDIKYLECPKKNKIRLSEKLAFTSDRGRGFLRFFRNMFSIKFAIIRSISFTRLLFVSR